MMLALAVFWVVETHSMLGYDNTAFVWRAVDMKYMVSCGKTILEGIFNLENT